MIFYLLSFGAVQNTVDVFEINFLCFKPTKINWKKEHDIQDVINSRLDKKKEKYIEV